MLCVWTLAKVMAELSALMCVWTLEQIVGELSQQLPYHPPWNGVAGPC